MKNLVLVESPTKAKRLAQFLGKGFQVESTLGHLRDLPQKKLGVDVDQDFVPQYVTVKGKEKTVRELRKAAKGVENLLLAMDPDREGEAIAFHASQILGKKKIQILRAVFHEITKEAVAKAIKNPREIDLALVDAQKARRVLDRLVGYKLSPLLWKKIQRGLSAGRVQSVALRLVVEREEEIKGFVPQEYWLIDAELEKSEKAKSGPQSFLARLVKKDGEKIEIKNKKEADGALKILKSAEYQVAGVEKKEVKKSAPPPFTTSSLQQAAGNFLRFSTKKTMVLAQKLYEQGLITYHRTDSLSLAKEAVAKCRSFVKKTYGEEYLPSSPRFYKTRSKVAQEAHEAIRPTKVGRQPSAISDKLGRDLGRLYTLIWKRFVACQMTNQLVEETKVKVEARAKKPAAVFLFQAVGRVEKFPGWKRLYQNSENQDEKEETKLPSLRVDEVLTLIDLLSEQKFTQPPPRYSEASLVRVLEEKGIGRPSTYAPTISTIQSRQYVIKEEGKLKPTELGVVVNGFLVKHFPKVVDYSFTARMEDDLDEIANGKKEWVPVIKEFYQPFADKLDKVAEKAKKVKVEEKLGEKCPQCGAPLVIKFGRYGKFISCSKFPKCEFKKNYVEKIGQKCRECDGEVIVRKTKRGRTFYGCSNWPKCKWASWQKPKPPPRQE